jgi:outer membrane biosynthesis protein TonB
MAIAGMPKGSLRLDHESSRLLVWAVLISMTVHTAILGGYYAGNKQGWWQNLHWPAWLRPVKTLVEAFKKKEPPPKPLTAQEPPLMFIDVSPAQASAEAPPNAKFYSDKNALAANPTPEEQANTPKIEGTQTQVAKTEDIPRQEFKPLQPTPPALPAPEPPKPEPPKPEPPKPEPPKPEPVAQMKDKPAETPGDLAVAKTDPAPTPAPKTEEAETRPRPRTIKEALALHPEKRLAGQKMKQEGGVHRQALVPSFDTKATPFGAYDAELIEAIQDRWYNLLDARDYAAEGRGKVMLQFVLHYDGRISDMKIVDRTVSEVLAYLCEKAVLDPSPFRAWPSDMRRMMGETRPIQFTFYYN